MKGALPCYFSSPLKKLQVFFSSMDDQWCSFVTKDCITALKLFPAVCCYGWRGQIGIELKL